MLTRKMIIGFLVCFLIAVFMGQALSQTRGTARTRERFESSRSRNTDREQGQQELVQRRLKQQLEGQFKKQIDPAKSEKELMKQILRATEEQWKAIKPRLDKVRELRSLANVSIELMCYGGAGGSMRMSGSSVAVNNGFGRGSMSGTGYGSSSRGMAMPLKDTNSDASSIRYGWRWFRPSQHKDPENLNEGEKICEGLFGLLEDNSSELEEITQKMEALRKFRQEAKKELSVVQQELRQLVTPRQEAAFVMMGLLD